MGTKKGGARKGKPKGSRLAYDDTADITTDRELKPLRRKTTVGQTRKGIRKIPVSGTSARYDEAILRLIQTDIYSSNVLQAIERLILGKYK